MNIKRFSLIAVFLFVLTGAAFAQQELTVRGKVIDRDGQPIPGVAVIVQGTKGAALTDVGGYYVIEVPSPSVKLEFTCLGYKTQVLSIPRNFILDVYLDEDTLEMEESVVVGMGTQRKVSVIGAVSAIENERLQVPQRNLTNALAGKVAGAVVVQRTGEPGVDNAEFWIRGISSLNSSSPLVLVDGVERDMSDLSIEEIESISVLKDASATAVYGVRAANGVVIVTTRRGVAQKPVIEVKVEGGVSDLTSMPQLMDGANYMRLANEAAGYEMYTSDAIYQTEHNTDPFLYPNVNWFDTLFKKYSNNSQAAVSVRGGGERARYYATLAYIEDNGNLNDNPEADYSTNIHVSRYNFRSNIDMDITPSTVLALEIGANMTDAHQPAPITNTNPFSSIATELFSLCYSQNPITTPVRVPIGRDLDGNIDWGWGSDLTVSVGNPAERLFGSGYNKTSKSQIMSQILLKQDLAMITEGLKAQLSFSYDANSSNVQSRRRYSSLYAINGINDDGEYIISQTRVGDDYLGYGYLNSSDRATELKAQLNYDRVFAEKHRVGAMLMYYQREYVITDAPTSTAALPYRKQGIAFRTTYSFADRYFAEFNAGYNGSENFEKGHRFGFFPAGALGYLISGEEWWNVSFINYLKLRASVGLVGSDVLAANGRFGYLSTWGFGLGSHRFGGPTTGTTLMGIGEEQEGVSDLTWEKGLKKDVGLEIKMFDSRLSLNFDYFHERRWDILIQRSSVPAIAGLNTQPYANMGVMTNHGFEGTGEFADHIGDFGYRLYGNFSFARNKILEKDEAPTDPWRMRTGRPYGQCFGLVATGIFQNEDEIANSPVQEFGSYGVGDVKYLDYNKDNVINSHDEVPIGFSRVPELNFGFGFQLTWKGFDFGAFFRGQSRVTYYLGSTYFPFYTGVGKNNLFMAALDHVSVTTDELGNPIATNVDARYPRLTATANANNMQTSTRTIYDGSLIRLSDLEFGYTLAGNDFIKRFGCQSVRFYLVGTNILRWSPWTMWDPETGSRNGNAYPLSRKINIGARLTF